MKYKQTPSSTHTAAYRLDKNRIAICIVVVVVLWYCLSGARLLRSISRGGINWWNNNV